MVKEPENIDARSCRRSVWPTAACLAVGLALALSVGAAPSSAQQDSLHRAVHQDTTSARHKVSGRGAFLRALALPGWGHAYIGAWNRGAFYFTAESATAWALIRTRVRLLEARRRASFRESVLRQRLAAQGITDPSAIQTQMANDTTLKHLRGLANARATQQQDWVALGVFLVFLSGADAYVSANLQHFPVPITVNQAPTGPSGRMQISVSVPVPDH